MPHSKPRLKLYLDCGEPGDTINSYNIAKTFLHILVCVFYICLVNRTCELSFGKTVQAKHEVPDKLPHG